MKWERVHTMDDWYDGPIAGVADVDRLPHTYVRDFSEARDAWTENYWLQPLGAERLALIMEQWAIWAAWLAAFRAGGAPPSTLPPLSTLPKRFHEAKALIGPYAADPATSFLRRGEFRCVEGVDEVCWLDPDER